MKKIYMIPTVAVMKITPATLMVGSLPKDGGSGNELGEDEILVKEQRQGDYNVWDDDWSR